MSFLFNGIAFLLGAYLALINAAATGIIAFLPSPEEGTPLASAGESLTPISGTPKEAIPDILLRNADYQRAAVAESVDPSEARSTALEALVNIYCSYTSGNYTKTTTGTGFIIDTNGVILTNAHVAQFLLLEGIVGSAQCIIRTGDPATPMYEAELLYIPPAWIREHANLINEMSPKGTGERDYALLYINAALDHKPMPSRFPALPFDTDLLPTSVLNSSVFATGYPAEALIENGTDAPLVPKQATTSIAELMTFGSDYVDLFTIRGSQIGEHGSSGGPVVDEDGKAIGIISTKGDDAKFGDGSLRAVSLSYIDRTIKEETGFSLVQNLGGDLPYRAALFKKTMIPFLQQIMEGTL
jgi:S1-C subfamily serine protease